MIYKIEDQNEEYEDVFLQHEEDISERKFEQILSSVRFSQGHYPDFSAGIAELIRKYRFKEIQKGYL